MASSYNLLLPEVLPECQGLAEPIAINAIRKAVRYFCEESTAWRYELPLISTVTDQGNPGEYTLTPPADTQIMTVLSPVQHNGISIHPISEQKINSVDPKWREQDGTQAKNFVMLASNVMRLVPYQLIAQPDSLRVSVALKPTLASVDFDDWVYNEYGEFIACLAKGELMLMPNKPWTNPELGMYYKGLGRDEISNAFSKITSGFIKGKTDRNNRVKGHFF